MILAGLILVGFMVRRKGLLA
ncbi:hypothetical protein [Nitrosospira multiformis]|nr:hypothetical protein [Nitrosospira multiformis]